MKTDLGFIVGLSGLLILSALVFVGARKDIEQMRVKCEANGGKLLVLRDGYACMKPESLLTV